MLRSDQNLTRWLFSEGLIKVFFCNLVDAHPVLSLLFFGLFDIVSETFVKLRAPEGHAMRVEEEVTFMIK